MLRLTKNRHLYYIKAQMNDMDVHKLHPMQRKKKYVDMHIVLLCLDVQ